jgi:hypothetical protein
MYQLTTTAIFTGPGGPAGMQTPLLRAVLDFRASDFDIASDQQSQPGVQTQTIRYSTNGTTLSYQSVCPNGGPLSTVQYSATSQSLVVFSMNFNGQTVVEVFTHQ